MHQYILSETVAKYITLKKIKFVTKRLESVNELLMFYILHGLFDSCMQSKNCISNLNILFFFSLNSEHGTATNYFPREREKRSWQIDMLIWTNHVNAEITIHNNNIKKILNGQMYRPNNYYNQLIVFTLKMTVTKINQKKRREKKVQWFGFKHGISLVQSMNSTRKCNYGDWLVYNITNEMKKKIYMKNRHWRFEWIYKIYISSADSYTHSYNSRTHTPPLQIGIKSC